MGGPEWNETHGMQDPGIAVDAALRQCYWAKLFEYSRRGSAGLDAYGRLRKLYKEKILQTVLELTDAQPTGTQVCAISMQSIADAIFGPNDSISQQLAAIPFMTATGPNGAWQVPDLLAIDAALGLHAVAFADAYGVLSAYSHGREDMVLGGTGLPGAVPT